MLKPIPTDIPEVEFWQRVACRLTLALWEALPNDAGDFFRLSQDLKDTALTLADAGFDVSVLGDLRLGALLPAEVEALNGLSWEIRSADFHTECCSITCVC